MELNKLIIDDPVRGLFRVHRSVMTSLQILALERERIFDQSWLYLGHESEVPHPGDYRRRTVGGRPVFFVRGSDGQVRAFLNTCTHRGALVCRRDAGTAEVFQCFYHAWTFNNKGELIGIPDEAGYSAGFDRREMALKSPRLESYRGFYFVSFNPEIEDLVSYLAGAREYIDLVADQAEQGMRVIPGANRYEVRANWKLLVENSMDGYHFVPVHETYISYLDSLAGTAYRYPRDRGRGDARGKALGNGHAVMENPTVGRPIANWHPIFGDEAKEEIARMRARLVERYGEERAHLMADVNRNLFIYPNLIINDISGITIRTFWPLAPDRMEVLAWVLAPSEERGSALYRRLSHFLIFLGPGGFATPDDVEALESCQIGFQADPDGWSDISRGMQREGDARSHHELQMRVFWRQWHAQLQGFARAERTDDLLPAERITT